MKTRHVRLLFLFLFVIAIAPAYSGTPTAGSARKTILLWRKGASGRPNAPSRENIEFYYGYGMVALEFPDDIHGAYVTIGNPISPTWSAYLTSEEPQGQTPLLVGPYEVTVTTEYNEVYTGTAHF